MMAVDRRARLSEAASSEAGSAITIIPALPSEMADKFESIKITCTILDKPCAAGREAWQNDSI